MDAPRGTPFITWDPPESPYLLPANLTHATARKTKGPVPRYLSLCLHGDNCIRSSANELEWFLARSDVPPLKPGSVLVLRGVDARDEHEDSQWTLDGATGSESQFVTTATPGVCGVSSCTVRDPERFFQGTRLTLYRTPFPYTGVYPGSIVAHYDFGDPANLGRDVSGNNLDGTPVGLTRVVEGTRDAVVFTQGHGLLLEDPQRVNLTPRVPAFQAMGNNITVSLWFKTTTSSAGVAGLFTFSDDTRPSDDWLLFIQSNILRFMLRVDAATVWQIASTTLVNDGEWHHVIASSGSAGNYAFLDGVQLANTVGSSTSTASFNDVAYNRINIGCSKDDKATFEFSFSGSISEVRVFREQLATELYVTRPLRQAVSFRNLLHMGRYMTDTLTQSTSPTMFNRVVQIGNLVPPAIDYVYFPGDMNVETQMQADALFTSVLDTRPAFILVGGNMTVAAGVTIVPPVRKLFMYVFVRGNLTLEGGFSMTARGANHNGTSGSGFAEVFPARDIVIAQGVHVPAVGGAGGRGPRGSPGLDNLGMSGAAGLDGATGGGGGGGSQGGARTTDGFDGNQGTAGTAFSGGTGGRGSISMAAPVAPGAAAEPNGGRGGVPNDDATTRSNQVGGGAGNPGGGSATLSRVPPDGTGGTLVVTCLGHVTGAGSLQSRGSDTNINGRLSGMSGGGSVTLLCRSGGESVSIDALGGDGTLGTRTASGGAGSARLLRIPPVVVDLSVVEPGATTHDVLRSVDDTQIYD